MMRKLLFVALLVGGCRHDLGPPPDGYDPDNMNQNNNDEDDIGDATHFLCVSQTKKVESIGVDMLFVIDTSYSMDFNLKWESVAQALKTFVGNPQFAGISVGLQYFPLRDACDVDAYRALDVPFGELPMATPDLVASIARQQMAGGTPTAPALKGTLMTAMQRALMYPDRRVAVVLATDGIPDASCGGNSGQNGLPNTIDSAVSLVTEAAQAGVVTYVVGVGAELSALNEIAVAGKGVPKAFLVDATQNVQGTFAAALDSIRKVALTCEFTLPDPPAGLVLDKRKVNVVYSATSATNERLTRVSGLSQCDQVGQKGWYYDDPLMPSHIVLCTSICDDVRNSNEGKIDIEFGCEAIVP